MKLRRYALTLALVVLSTQAQAEIVNGHVVGVTDGDTITLLDAKRIAHKVRVSGIDAPERTQPFGQPSKQSLSALAYGKHARADCPKRDRYRRLVCTVYVDGTDVGLAQVAAGMAWWYRKYAHEQPAEQRPAYSDAELKANQRRIGLWADEAPTPPWEYRHRSTRETQDGSRLVSILTQIANALELTEIEWRLQALEARLLGNCRTRLDVRWTAGLFPLSRRLARHGRTSAIE